MVVKRHHFFITALFLAGCAPRPTAVHPAKIVWEGKANLTLDQITPVPHLESPTTQPDSRPPIEALILYTRALDAMANAQLQVAIESLEQAIKLDPYRYDLRYKLGQAYASGHHADDQAITAFEKAAQLQPDSLAAQVELGQLYLNKSNPTLALTHLRLAMQTPEYSVNDASAALVDYFLAKALKNSGYDRAALKQYTQLLDRMQNPSASMQQSPEVAFLFERPDELLEQIGELFEKHGDYADALKAFGPTAAREPDNFDLQSRYTRDLVFNGQREAAIEKSVNLVVRSHASPASLQLLGDVCRLLNIGNGVVTELQKLRATRPDDKAVLFALADTLLSNHQSAQAFNVLQSAWQKDPADIAITCRLFFLNKQQDRVMAAAGLLLHALACNPDALQNYLPLWMQLLRLGQPNRLTLVSLQVMDVASEDEAARQVWVAVTAAHDKRMTLQRMALEAATRRTPPFAPAFRTLMELIGARPSITEVQNAQAWEDLIQDASRSGDPALAAELRGRMLIRQKSNDQAGAGFAEAVRLGGRSPELILALANARRTPGRDADFERALWKIISDNPMYEPGFATLHSYYEAPGTESPEQANKVVLTWLTNDPQNTTARLLIAQNYARSGDIADADREFSNLFADDPDNKETFLAIADFYTHLGRTKEFISKLDAARVSHPRDTDLIARIVDFYAGQDRRTEAIRLVDSTRTLVADEPDRLYAVAGCYLALDQKPTSEEVLAQVLSLNPTHSGACNDLGFDWANSGRNLSQAEALIRIAVAREPDNAAFLDSLGWVLYKRGRFAEACDYLKQAVVLAVAPDAVVTDHLADALYRLNKPDEAMTLWKQSLNQLVDGSARVDQQPLRLQLLQKIKQAEDNKPVAVQ